MDIVIRVHDIWIVERGSPKEVPSHSDVPPVEDAQRTLPTADTVSSPGNP